MNSANRIVLAFAFLLISGPVIADTEAEITRALEYFDDLKAIAQTGEDRGVLEYSHIQVKALEKKHALAYGELHLKFKDGSALNSWFTTVYLKTPFGWKAILTHN